MVISLQHERDNLKNKLASLQLQNKGLKKGLTREREALAEEKEEGDLAMGITSVVHKKNISLHRKIDRITGKHKAAQRAVQKLKPSSRRRHNLIMHLRKENSQLVQKVSQLKQVIDQRRTTQKILEQERHISQQLNQKLMEQTKVNTQLKEKVERLKISISFKDLQIKRMHDRVQHVNNAAKFKIRCTLLSNSKVVKNYK